MPVFVTSKSAARRHGVYAIEATQPATITATGTGTVVLVDQFSWGPEQVLTYPSDTTTLINMVAPPGASHTTNAYMSLIRKGFARLGFVRVVATDATKATCPISNAVPTLLFTVAAKYKGAVGGQIVITVTDATDGNAQHFDMTATLNGASGTTVDKLQNCVGDVTLASVDLSKCVLIGSITHAADGRPPNGVYMFTGGNDGTTIASDWTGTQGTGDKGIALLEGDPTVDFVVPGYAGTLRAQVNAAAVAHCDYMTDRMCVINGPSGQTAAQAQTDVASYRSIRAIYVDPWVYIYDEAGTKQLVPPSSFLAAVASQLPPSTSVAWKARDVQSMLNGIVDVEASRGVNAADNTAAGIVTVTKEITSGFTFESAKNTYYATDPTKGTIKRTRMGHYLARSVTASLRPYVDSPNVAVNQQDEFEAVQEFLGKLKANSKKDPNKLTHIADFSMSDPAAMNAQSDLDNGEYTIGADVKVSSDQEKIFLMLRYGENVNPQVSAT